VKSGTAVLNTQDLLILCIVLNYVNPILTTHFSKQEYISGNTEEMIDL